MSKSKQPQVPKKNDASIVRSSAAEYLTDAEDDGNPLRCLGTGH